MSAGEVGMLVLNLVAFILMAWLCTAGLFYSIEAFKGSREERRAAKTNTESPDPPSPPAPDREASAVASAADLAAQQRGAKVRAHFAFRDEIKKMREDRWDQ